MKSSGRSLHIFAAIVACMFLAPSAWAAEFRYDGKSNLAITLGAPDHIATAEFAARELARCFSLMLGHDIACSNTTVVWPDQTWLLRVETGGASPPPSPGTNRTARADSDEFQISAAAHSLTITASTPAALLSAIFHLLEQQGCAWLFPGPNGEIVPRGKAVVIVTSCNSRADFSMRGLSPVENLQRYTEADVRDMMDWMGRNRLNYFVPIINYGWARLGKTVVEESRKRGVHLAGYVWSFELFLPLEVGRSHPEYFAFFDGKRHVDYNVKRCASSPEAIRLFVENGTRWFREHPEIQEWIVIPNDGFHWCECEKCRRLKPKDQWAAFFTPLLQALASTNPSLTLHNFIYVTRYGLPENLEPYQDARLTHFFDVHQRNKWFSLRDPATPIDQGNREGEVASRRSRFRASLES